MFFNLVSDNESEHENEEEEWEAQQIRKGVTGAQVKAQFIKIKKEKNLYKIMVNALNLLIDCSSTTGFYVATTIHNEYEC